jgi:hypothetical protein
MSRNPANQERRPALPCCSALAKETTETPNTKTMSTHFACAGEFTAQRAKELGVAAGVAAAKRYLRDPESFEDTPNPFGIDSESDLHAAWQDAYEDVYEANR